MSTNHETRSAKSGKVLGDLFDPGRPFVTLANVGRMQRRGIVTVLFDPTDDKKTVPFVTVFRGSEDGAKYVVAGVRYNGKGEVVVAKAASVKTEPAPIVLQSEPETTEAAMGI